MRVGRSWERSDRRTPEIFGSVGWDAGYNLDRYPSYGPYWQTRHPHWNQRLTELGAYQAAHAEETAASR